MIIKMLNIFESESDAENENSTIEVEYEGRIYSVSWYNDVSEEDVKEAIVCACDAIMDSGFQLYDANGLPIPISNLASGERYLLKPGDELKGYEKALGDRWRRLKLEMDPLRHTEAQKGIECMKEGSNMLKHTRNGPPHIRMFQLTSDMTRLIWYSGNKDYLTSVVDLRQIEDIKTGQRSDTFKKYPIPALDHLSFSIYYDKKTLDITCKDEKEFDLWVAGCKAIFYHFRDMNISKQILLSHSRRFLEALRTEKASKVTSVLYSNPDSKTLEECIVRASFTPGQMSLKLATDRARLTSLSASVANLPERTDYDILAQKSDQKLAYGSEYLELDFNEEEDEVYSTEEQRLQELISTCQIRLSELENEFETCHRNNILAPMAQFENKVWKLEIDIENASDILKRIEKANEGKWSDRVKKWFKNIF